MEVRLLDVRPSFPALFAAEAFKEGDTPYYSATFPIDPKSANHKALKAAIAAVAKEKWADKAEKVLALIYKEGNVAYKEEEKLNKDGEALSGFEGVNSVRASNAKRPLVVHRNGEPIVKEADSPVYAGCYVNAIVDVWAQDHPKFGRKINVRLLGVQFVKDGESFGGGVRIGADAFGALEDAEEALG